MNLSFIINLQATDPKQWEQAMDGLKQIVEAFPVPLMRLAETQQRGCKRLTWKKDVVFTSDKGELVELKGDYYSREFGSTFKLYTHLHHQMQEMGDADYSRPVFHLSPTQEYFDCLPGYNGYDLFHQYETGGFTYTYAVLAMGIYLEHCFYDTAYLSGDYNTEQIQLVTEWLESLFAQPIQLPKTILQPQLWQKLQPAYDDVQHAITRFWFLSRCTRKDKIAFLLGQNEEAIETFLITGIRHFNSVSQWGAKDLLLPYLLACNDLERFLLFYRKVQQAIGKDGFALIELLKLLINEGICDKPFQNDMLKEFHKERASLQSGTEVLYRMLFQLGGMPNKIDFYAPPDELLELFAYYEPKQGIAFKKLLDEKVAQTEERRAALNQKLEETIEGALDKASVEMEENEYDPIFIRSGLAQEDYFIQSAIADKKQYNNFEDLARHMGQSTIASLKKYSEEFGKDKFGRPTVEVYLNDICFQIAERGLALSEDTWQAIEDETDEAILQGLLYMATLSSREMKFWDMRKRFFESPEYWGFLGKE